MSRSSVEWLFGRTAEGIRWGLERIETILAGAGNPHRRFRSLLVGGTNGKGSVAALCASALVEGGRARIGLYTSPHLVAFRERIRIDGRPVSDDRIGEVAERLRGPIEATGATFFEATTAIAFTLFAEEGVDFAVVEVGLGGRLDATNVLLPEVTLVTNVARDHEEYLGAEIPSIALEKAGIFKAGVPAITGSLDPEAIAVLFEHAAAVGAPFETLDQRAKFEVLETGRAGTRLRLESRAWGVADLWLRLPGVHQAANAALAAEALALLPTRFRPTLDELTAGFAIARWPGRMQVELLGGTTWLLDVAHNPDGVLALTNALPTLDLPRPWVLLVSILADKNWPEMLGLLAASMDVCVVTVPTSAALGRRWDPGAALDALVVRGVHGVSEPDLGEAVERAAQLAGDGTVIVSGSVHTVGDTLEILALPTF